MASEFISLGNFNYYMDNIITVLVMEFLLFFWHLNELLILFGHTYTYLRLFPYTWGFWAFHYYYEIIIFFILTQQQIYLATCICLSYGSFFCRFQISCIKAFLFFIAYGSLVSFSLLVVTYGFILISMLMFIGRSIYWKSYILEHYIRSLSNQRW